MWFWQWPKWCTSSFLSVITFVLEISIIIFDILDWVERAVLQFSAKIVAPRFRETRRLSFLGIWAIKLVKSLWLAYILRVSLYHLSSSCPILENWFTMESLWQAALLSYGMMSPARMVVFNFLYLLRILQTMLTISVPLWLVPSVCNCLILVDSDIVLPETALVISDNTVWSTWICRAHGIYFTTSKLGLMDSAIEIRLTQIQEGGVRLESQLRISLSELVFHSICPPVNNMDRHHKLLV